MPTDHTCNNIRILRERNHETQRELAEALGLAGAPAIANYEIGNRRPGTELRRKIAQHFHVTEDQLVHDDMSDGCQPDLLKLEAEERGRILRKIFPLFYTKEAMEDRDFRRAFEINDRVMREAPDEPVRAAEIPAMLQGYREAWRRGKHIVIQANLIPMLYLSGAVLNSQALYGLEKSEWAKYARDPEGLRAFLRKEPEEPETLTQKAERRTLLEEVCEELDMRLNLLYAAGEEWTELAYYYSTYRFRLGNNTNGFSPEMNEAVGAEMLYAIARLGNRYARRTLRLLAEQAGDAGPGK